MTKKKAGKSKAAKMRSLPAKTISARSAKRVKGGATPKGSQPTENISLNFSKVKYDY
ncbi:MAG TPA: hypothetical protein VIZ58_11065 [Thermoanaerobaculia bacterium]